MHQLYVVESDLIDATALLMRVGLPAGSELSLRLDDGELIVAGSHASVAVPATGTWRGTVFVPAEMLDALVLPSGDQVRIAASDDGKLTIGDQIFDCRIVGVRPPVLTAAGSAAAEAVTRRLRALQRWGLHRIRDTAEGVEAAYRRSRTGRSRLPALPISHRSRPPASVPGRADGRVAVRTASRVAVGILALALVALAARYTSRLDAVELPGPIYDTAVAVGLPLDMPQLTRLGIEAVREGRLEAAVAILTDAASRYRRSSIAGVELARVYLDVGDSAAATLVLERLLADHPADRTVILELGSLHFQRGLHLERRREQTQAIRAFASAERLFAAGLPGDPVLAGWAACARARAGFREAVSPPESILWTWCSS
jgi:hypothetical protein